MSEKKSLVVFRAGQEAAQKFDYFMAGLTGAIIAYIAQAYTPKKLAFDHHSLEPLGLVLLALSFYFGLKRIESTITATRMNFQSLHESESAGAYTKAIAEGRSPLAYNPSTGEIVGDDLHGRRDRHMKRSERASELHEEVATKASRYYKLRNWFLLAGFAAIFSAKILSPYFEQ